MIPRKYTYHYSRNIKIALVISLTIIISLFFIPFNKLFETKNNTISQNILFYSNNIPPTVQTSELNISSLKRPQEPAILIPSEISSPEVLSDVEISNKESNSSGSNLAVTKNGKNATVTSLPYIPKQILEVMPQKVNVNAKGLIKLSLKIGTNGKVVSYIVLANTTDCPECLKNVIDAVHKSKWEPAFVNGKKIDFWIEKSYKFN